MLKLANLLIGVHISAIIIAVVKIPFRFPLICMLHQKHVTI